jgi:hypothetical protein
MGRDFQRVLRFGGQQDQVKLVSLSVVVNCSNANSICPHTRRNCSAQRTDAHYQYLHFEGSKIAKLSGLCTV